MNNKLRFALITKLIILMFMTAFIVFELTMIRSIGKSNNSYLRTMVCIASETPTQRTPEYVKSCYDMAEKANNNHIERYGSGK